MSCHLKGRNQRRDERPKIKNILQVALLLFLLMWFLYKTKQTYDKRNEISLFKFPDEDGKTYSARLRKAGYDSDADLSTEEVDASARLYEENDSGSMTAQGSMDSQKEDSAEIHNTSSEQNGNTNVEQGLSEENGLQKEYDIAENFTLDSRNNDETDDVTSNSDTSDNGEYALNREGANSQEGMDESPTEEDNAISINEETVRYRSDNILGAHIADSDSSEEANSDKGFGGEITELSLGYDQHNEGIRTSSEASDPDGKAVEYLGVVENEKNGSNPSEEDVRDLDDGTENSSQISEQIDVEIENNTSPDG